MALARRWKIPLVLLLVPLLAVLLSARADRPADQVSARWASPQSKFADVLGMKVHYRDEGAGPSTVMLIHGTFASLHTWDDWTTGLSRDLRVVRLDLPGHGLTGPDPTRDYGMARTLEVVRSLADQLGLERFSLAGNSLGGHVAWRFAAAHPERVERLVLLDATGYPFDRPPPIVLLGQLPILNRLLLFATPESLIAHNIDEVYGDDSKITPALVERYHDLTLREGNRRALFDRLSNPEPERPELIATVKAPTLVQWGELDEWVPLRDGERFEKELPDARLVVYPGVGHLPHEELPEQSARDALEFLLRQAGD